MSFQVGDRIKCVRPDGTGLILLNKTYKVESLTKTSTGEIRVVIEGCRGRGWRLDRFVLLKEKYKKNLPDWF